MSISSEVSAIHVTSVVNFNIIPPILKSRICKMTAVFF